MAHELDLTTGKAAFAYAERDGRAWHGLGTAMADDESIDAWSERAGMFEVAESPVKFWKGEDELATYDARKVLYRTDTGMPLEVVADAYKVVQPKQVVEFFRDLVEDLGTFRMATAGVLREGRRVWALAEAKEGAFEVGKGDKVNRFLLLATSYDLTLRTICMQTSIRVVCANTLRATGIETKGRVRGGDVVAVSHLNEWNPDKVKEAVGIAGWEAFRANCERLAGVVVSEAKAKDILWEAIYPEEQRQRAKFSEKAAAKHVDKLLDAWRNCPGANLPGAKGTLWGVVNAVTWWYDHGVKERKAGNRQDNAWFGYGAMFKDRTFKTALQAAGA